jgi:penicillin-binding protein 1C
MVSSGRTGTAAVLGLVGGLLLAWVAYRPLDRARLDAGLCTTVLDRYGRSMGVTGRIGCIEAVSEAELPPDLVSILVAIEDHRFWKHGGVDLPALLSALVSPRSRGASTLTMQLTRLVGLSTRDRTLSRKVRELLLALRVERTLSKREVIGLYLSRAPFGRGIVGVAEASRIYFGKRPSALSFEESAMLVALLPAPSALDPRFNRVGACSRRQLVLGLLRSKAELRSHAEAASLTPCTLAQPMPRAPTPLAVEMVAAIGQERRTTIDLGTQAIVDAILVGFTSRFRSAGANEAAAVVLDTQTAQLLAVSAGEGTSSLNPVLVPRQAGSALKPFLYLRALQEGYTMETGIDDSPSEFRDGSVTFVPQNADREFRGRISLAEALAESRNVPAVRLVQSIGAEPFAKTLGDFGVELQPPLQRYGLGIALGTPEVRLLDLTGAYATLARKGVQFSPTLDLRTRAPRRVAPAGDCDSICLALSDDDARARGFGSDSRLRNTSLVAVKTGTSPGGRDRWLFVTTPRITIGLWAGNFDMSQADDTAAMSLLLPVGKAILEELGLAD